MDFVNDINFIVSLGGGVFDFIFNVMDLFNFVIGSGVDFNYVI